MQTTIESHRKACCQFVPTILLFAIASSGWCEDSVTYRASTGEKTVVGTITQWTGDEITVRNTLGREATLTTSSIVAVNQPETKLQRQAAAKFAAAEYAAAAELYLQAAKADSRQWKQREMVSHVVQCRFEQSQWVASARLFLNIIDFDKTTPYYHTAPLFWKSHPLDSSAKTQAIEWLKDDRPAAQVIAASWLLNSPDQRDAAKAKLTDLSTGSDPRVASLAQSQLWRLQVTTATKAEATRWRTTLEKTPIELQPGRWFMVAQALAQNNEHEQAAVAAMRVPILFPTSHSLAAESLLLAGRELKKAGIADEAASIFREIVNTYSTSTAAAIAKAELTEKN